MAAKGRKTTRKSIEAMFPIKENSDLIAIEVLVKLAENKLKMERQKIYEYDEIFLCEEFYGDYKSLSITVQFRKKEFGITGKYYMYIENDKDRIQYKTRVAAKAWSLCCKNEKLEEESFIAPDSTIDNILLELRG